MFCSLFYLTINYQEASDDLLTAQVLHEHGYADTSQIRFNKRTGKYLPRTEQDDKNLESVFGPIDLEDLSYLREVLTEQKLPIKWTPHPVTKSTRKVSFSTIFFWQLVKLI